MHRRREPKLSLLERAVIEKQWHSTTVTARIHTLIGNSSEGMVNAAGRVFFVVLGAAVAEHSDAEQVDIRIIRGAVNSVFDLAGQEDISDERRASIDSGLRAAERLVPTFARRSLTDSACELELKLRGHHVHMSDFAAVLANLAPLYATPTTGAR